MKIGVYSFLRLVSFASGLLFALLYPQFANAINHNFIFFEEVEYRLHITSLGIIALCILAICSFLPELIKIILNHMNKEILVLSQIHSLKVEDKIKQICDLRSNGQNIPMIYTDPKKLLNDVVITLRHDVCKLLDDGNCEVDFKDISVSITYYLDVPSNIGDCFSVENMEKWKWILEDEPRTTNIIYSNDGKISSLRHCVTSKEPFFSEKQKASDNNQYVRTIHTTGDNTSDKIKGSIFCYPIFSHNRADDTQIFIAVLSVSTKKTSFAKKLLFVKNNKFKKCLVTMVESIENEVKNELLNLYILDQQPEL